jgi:hypothetical protein
MAFSKSSTIEIPVNEETITANSTFNSLAVSLGNTFAVHIQASVTFDGSAIGDAIISVLTSNDNSTFDIEDVPFSTFTVDHTKADSDVVTMSKEILVQAAKYLKISVTNNDSSSIDATVSLSKGMM